MTQSYIPPDVASTEVSLDDSVPGYQHTFTLQHIIACGNRTTPVTTATFDFGGSVNITDYCYSGILFTAIQLNFQEHKLRASVTKCIYAPP